MQGGSVSSTGILVKPTEDLPAISASMLSGYDVLMFALTTGELAFSPDQRAAILRFVENGGGFVGVHSATDTLYQWPEYGQLVGAYFKDHPWTQTGSIVTEDPAHPASGGLTAPFSLKEEFYTFRENPRHRVHVLARLDPASVGASGDFPLVWAQTRGRGRSYYNALGHFNETWRDPNFIRQLTAGIRWAAGRS
jgi:cytochrome c